MTKVFISYSHDSDDHVSKALHLAQQLRSDGLDCLIDQFVHGGPAEGWPRWMQRQVEESAFVLVICTETYKKRFEGKECPNQGMGADWEGILVLQQLYEAKSINETFVPVLFDGATENDIPLPLRPYTHYRLPRDNEALYRYLTAQPKVLPTDLGNVRRLPLDPL
jgi:hypothetical protein